MISDKTILDLAREAGLLPRMPAGDVLRFARAVSAPDAEEADDARLALREAESRLNDGLCPNCAARVAAPAPEETK